MAVCDGGIHLHRVRLRVAADGLRQSGGVEGISSIHLVAVLTWHTPEMGVLEREFASDHTGR